MRLAPTPLAGAWVVETDRLGDERGWFARSHDAGLLGELELEPVGVQCNISYSRARDTLRGLHFQRAPHGEPKLVRCVTGSVWDVALDLRADSPSFLRWHAIELSAENLLAYYIPSGCAHGFQTLTDDATVLYMMGAVYVAGAADGVRWDDPAFSIDWPEPFGDRTISDRDRGYPDFTP